jgi:hypothetical protein
MNRRHFLLAAGSSGMGLVAASEAQAQLRRRGLRNMPIAPELQPAPAGASGLPVAGTPRFLSINITAIWANGIPLSLSEGDVTVYVGDTIVVKTSIVDRASAGQIINPGIVTSAAGGWPFIDSDGIWKLLWDHYMIAGTGQTLIVEDPLDLTGAPAEIILNVIPH